MENTIILTSGQKIDVLMQDEVSLDIDCSLRYIESGKKEIENYVEDISKKRLNIVIEDAKSEMKTQIDNGISEAQKKASISAKEVIDENILSMKSEINNYIINEVKPDIEQNKNDAYQYAQIASQASSNASEAYNNLSSSLELAQEVACGNIGDIKYTLRTSAPHGAVFCNGQILTEEQYPDLYNMILEDKLKNVSLEEYENQILTTGNCEFFAIDKEQKTIKIPTILQENVTDNKAYVVCYTGKDTEIDIMQEITLNNPFSLLDYKWSEYEISNASWLLSNGAFHSGVTYVSVYELLLKIYNGTETKDGVSVKLSTESYEDTDFVLNTDETTFRLPIKVKLASGNAVIGNGMALGLTNGSEKYGATTWNSSSARAISARLDSYGKTIPSKSSSDTYPTDGANLGVTTDPLKSGIETSSNSLKLYFYVGETIQDANVIVASQVLTKVANCIDRTVKSDKETVVGWGMPDYSAGVGKAANTQFTAESDGFLLYNYSGATSTNTLTINGISINLTTQAQYSHGVALMLPIPKSTTYKLTGGGNKLIFYPLKGVN